MGRCRGMPQWGPTEASGVLHSTGHTILGGLCRHSAGKQGEQAGPKPCVIISRRGVACRPAARIHLRLEVADTTHRRSKSRKDPLFHSYLHWVFISEPQPPMSLGVVPDPSLFVHCPSMLCTQFRYLPTPRLPQQGSRIKGQAKDCGVDLRSERTEGQGSLRTRSSPSNG